MGAQIKVTVKDKDQPVRSIYSTVSSGGSFGANPMERHIGLGKSAQILDLEVWWPTSNTEQHFSVVDKNQFIEIKEFAKSYTQLERPTVRLGGPKKTAVPSEKQAAEGSVAKR
jgi:hypothetical protein